MSTNESAAASLEGMILNERWKVVKKIDPHENSTGGFFSIGYIVDDGDRTAFLKALNFTAFFIIFNGKSVIEILHEQTEAYKYEKELLLRCKNNNLSKVSVILDEGEVNVPGHTISQVPFLIFEMADGDIRSIIEFNKQSDVTWKLKSLHNVAVGLMQLHKIEIGHQDLKPSNVLLFRNNLISKIGDLGRSLCKDITAPHDKDGQFPGDLSYTPPEYLYGYLEPDWNKRVKATDLYLLGSLVVFYFTGTNMTALLGKNIDAQFKWEKWGGTFENVKAYLIEGFYKSLEEFKSSIGNQELAVKLADLLVICCYPDPEKRGHPRAANRDPSSKFDLERIVSILDVLSKKSKFNLI